MVKKRRKKYTKRSTSGKRRTRRKVYTRRSTKRSLVSKIFNSLVAIVAISALILLIAVIIGEISNPVKTNRNPILDKIFTRNYEAGSEKENFSVNTIIDEIIYPSDSKKGEVLFKICIISDVHQDLENLKKAVEKIKTLECRNMFVIGDLTSYGDVNSLKEVRSVLDSSGVEYYAIPGDHDIAQSLDVENFNSVFGVNYHIMEYSGVSFLMIDNSPNFTPIGGIQMSWIEKNIEKVDFIVLSQPLFADGLNPPFSSTYMGSMPDVPEGDNMRKKQGIVKAQGEDLLDMIRKNTNIKAIFAGEHHKSSKLTDPVRSDLSHHVIGAVTSTVNDYPQSAIQSPRFSVLSLYEGKEYTIEDVSID